MNVAIPKLKIVRSLRTRMILSTSPWLDWLNPPVEPQLPAVLDEIKEKSETIDASEQTSEENVVPDATSQIEPIASAVTTQDENVCKEIKLVSGMFYFYGDHLGSSSVVTDSAGKVVQSVDYYPFGGIRHEYVDSTFENDYLYTGKEFDEELGVYYYGARYYMADVGRWMGEDPMILDIGGSDFKEKYGKELKQLLKETRGWNVYAYVSNNPVKYVDPTGNVAETFWDIANTIYDVGNIAYGGAESIYGAVTNQKDTVNSGVQHMKDGAIGFGVDAVATMIPFVPAGVTRIPTVAEKAGDVYRALDKTADVVRAWPVFWEGRQIINGIEYTIHALERMAPSGMIQKGVEMYSRGIPPSVVENAIKYGTKTDQLGGKIIHAYDDIRVVTNKAVDRVITVMRKGVGME